MLSLAYVVLKSGISCFSGVFPKNARVLPIFQKRKALGAEFQEQWRFGEPPGTKGSEMAAVTDAQSIAGYAQPPEARRHARLGARPCVQTMSNPWVAWLPMR